MTGTPTGSGVTQGTLSLNPSSATAGFTLLGAGVNGSQVFKVDSSGNMTATGTFTLPLTTSSTVGVLKLGTNSFMHMCCDTTNFTNVFVGASAGNFTQSGTQNTGVGGLSLATTTSGSQNTALGYAALSSANTGGQNTALGAHALDSLSDGSSNTAVGFFALEQIDHSTNNTAVGSGALQNAAGSSSTSNTAVGFDALLSNSTGASNTALGIQAGFSDLGTNANTTGSNNTFIGAFAGPSVPSANSLSNATAIGAYAAVGASNSLVLGAINGTNGAGFSTSVGIGITAPAFLLDVKGGIGSTTSTLVHAYGAIAADYRIGIGTTSPSAPVDAQVANGSGVSINAIGNINTATCFSVGGSGIPGGGTCSSDERLKKDIKPFESDVLSKVALLQPVTFHWRNELPEYMKGNAEGIGLIAQQVELIFPELVSTDQNGFEQVNYTKLPYLMLQAIRELKEQNDRKDQQVEDLKKQVEQLRQLVEKLAGQLPVPPPK